MWAVKGSLVGTFYFSFALFYFKGDVINKGVKDMVEKRLIDRIKSELQEGIRLAKCRKCGCMRETLESLKDSLFPKEIASPTSPDLSVEGVSDLIKNIEQWLNEMEPIEYACLGCNYCFPAVAMNIFHQFEIRSQSWPPVPGEYFAFCDGANCPVAVSTLASSELAEKLASLRPKELCIVGKTETENIGIDKVIKNIITNPTIRVLLLVGKDPDGHHSGRTLLALWENGVDGNMRVVGSPGKRPVLRNVTIEEVEIFRKQVKVVDMIGCVDEKEIVEKIRELSQEAKALPSGSAKRSFSGEVIASSSCGERVENTGPLQILTAQVIQAQEPDRVEMDKAGYFVIIPNPDKKIITVEHYSYDNRLLRIIEGKDARSIYWTIIKSGWVTQLTHAAYLGKELMKAELSIKLGFKYVQDGW